MSFLTLTQAQQHLRSDSDEADLTLKIAAAERSAIEYLQCNVYADQSALDAAIAAVPATIVEQVRALADSFDPAASGMWTTGLSPTGAEPATHFISAGLIGDDFAAIMPFSHFDDSDPAVWVTDPYDHAAFVALCELNGITSPPVETLMQIMSMVDVSDQQHFAAMARLGLVLAVEPNPLITNIKT